MASNQIIELESLLKPIADDNPVGDDIRENASATSPYSTIKDARTAARASERNHMFDSDTSEADQLWRQVLDLAPDILQNHAKDLEVASWYTEALIRRYGFQGLRDGFRLIHGLINQYWDDIYPLPDEDGIETRVASLAGLNGEGNEGVLIPPIRKAEITQGNDPGPYSLWEYQQVLDVEKLIDEEDKREKLSKLGFGLEDINEAVSQSDESFFIDITEDISESIDTYREISQTLDERCGINDSPPTSNIINILQDCLGAIKHLAKFKLPSDEEEDQSADSAESDTADFNASSQNNAQNISGPVKSREDAFRQLKNISAFFRKTEPHSPISYIIERAVVWGDMPLDSLIKELIPDPSARDIFGSLTGVKTEDDYN